MLKIAVVGYGTLAQATTECCQQHFTVSPYPSRTDLDLVWICHDTPMLPGDVPDNARVIQWIREAVCQVAPLPEGSIGPEFRLRKSPIPMIVSSQIPLGTMQALQEEFPHHILMYSPENIRVKSAVSDFTHQSRIVIGRSTDAYDNILHMLTAPFTKQLILTDLVTAEMVKHAVNCYLAMSIAFINEFARLSDAVGANIETISQALLTERRISPHAPLHAGGPFGGGHLARDIYTIQGLSASKYLRVPIIHSIYESNEAHREFTCKRDAGAL